MSNSKKYWDTIASWYNRAFERKLTYRRMYDFIKQSMQNDMTVLELGSGTGMVARNIADNVKRVVATDLSPKMIAKAKQIPHLKNVHFSVENIFELSFDSEKFDAVITSNLLHIIPEPEKALTEVRRVLKPGGIFIAPTFLWREATCKGRIKKIFMRMTHFPIYGKWNQENFVYLLQKKGFSIERTEKIKSDFSLLCVECKKIA